MSGPQIPPVPKTLLIEAVERLVRLDEASGQKDKAAQWRKTLEEAKNRNEPK